MKKKYQYAFTLTMRRGRQEIISGVNRIVDPTIQKKKIVSQRKIVNQICELTEDLEKCKTLSTELKATTDDLRFTAFKLKSLISHSKPEWRIIDKSLSS